MQVFVPYANPYKTAKCLDNKRLNKQILECLQILSSVTKIDIGWKMPKYVRKHPITLLWENDVPYLIKYTKAMCHEFFMRKGKIHKCDLLLDDCFNNLCNFPKRINPLSVWYCKYHQEILLHKNFEHYNQIWGKPIC